MLRVNKSALLALLILLLNGCKDIREKLMPAFTVNLPAITLYVPALRFVANEEIPVGALRVPVNLDSAVRANTGDAFGAGAISSIKIKKVVLEVFNADEKNNLSSFESGRMKLYNDTASVDIIAISFPSAYSDSMTVIPQESPELKPYLTGSYLNYNLLWKNRRTTTKQLKLSLRITLSVR